MLRLTARCSTRASSAARRGEELADGFRWQGDRVAAAHDLVIRVFCQTNQQIRNLSLSEGLQQCSREAKTAPFGYCRAHLNIQRVGATHHHDLAGVVVPCQVADKLHSIATWHGDVEKHHCRAECLQRLFELIRVVNCQNLEAKSYCRDLDYARKAWFVIHDQEAVECSHRASPATRL